MTKAQSSVSRARQQREAFERAARELAPDATEEQFNETLRKVLRAKPQEQGHPKKVRR